MRIYWDKWDLASGKPTACYGNSACLCSLNINVIQRTKGLCAKAMLHMYNCTCCAYGGFTMIHIYV